MTPEKAVKVKLKAAGWLYADQTKRLQQCQERVSAKEVRLAKAK